MKKFFAAVLAALSLTAFAQAPSRAVNDVGHGFYVSGTKVYSPQGSEVVMRGVNFAHYNAKHAGVPLFKVNTARIALDFTKPADTLYKTYVQPDTLAAGLLPIIGNWQGTCKVDPGSLQSVVDTWVVQAATWTRLNNTGIINIANEWGPKDSVVWRDEYITAIQRMRAAGYNGLLMVDSGNCGQDAADVVKYGRAVLDADPQHNILFDIHVYGGFAWPKATASWQQDYSTAMNSLYNSGLPFVVGEFGAGKNEWQSPTMLPPETLVAELEQHGVGWLSWSYDANDGANCLADDYAFSWVVNPCKDYTGDDAQLTNYGRTMRDVLVKYTTPPPVIPVLKTNPNIWCHELFACYLRLTSASPIGSKIVTWTVKSNPSQIYVTTAGIFGWVGFPEDGVYPFTLEMTDAKGNTSSTPMTFTISPIQPKGSTGGIAGFAPWQ